MAVALQRRLHVRGLRGAWSRTTASTACGWRRAGRRRPRDPRRHAAEASPASTSASACAPRATACRSSCSPRAARRSTRWSACKLGADDYVTKPFSFMELLARVEARAAPRPRRRAGGDANGEAARIRRRHRRLHPPRGAPRAAAPSTSPPREFRLLDFFVEHRGEVVTRDQLLDAVWGYDRRSRSRAPSTSTSPSCARRSRTTPTTPATSSPCTAWATSSSADPSRHPRASAQSATAPIVAALALPALEVIAPPLDRSTGRRGSRAPMGATIIQRVEEQDSRESTMPRATVKYGFEWKLFAWAGRLAQQRTGANRCFLFLPGPDGAGGGRSSARTRATTTSPLGSRSWRHGTVGSSTTPSTPPSTPTWSGGASTSMPSSGLPASPSAAGPGLRGRPDRLPRVVECDVLKTVRVKE